MANESAYLSAFEPGMVMHVEFSQMRGQIQTFVVQLEFWDDEHWLPAVRFDNSHGRAHKDTMNRVGRQIATERLPLEWTANVALTFAIDDIRTKRFEYKRQFWES